MRWLVRAVRLLLADVYDRLDGVTHKTRRRIVMGMKGSILSGWIWGGQRTAFNRAATMDWHW